MTSQTEQRVYCPGCGLPGKDITGFDDEEANYMCSNVSCLWALFYTESQALTREQARLVVLSNRMMEDSPNNASVAAQAGLGGPDLEQGYKEQAIAEQARQARHSSSRQDWGTPPEILQAARAMLGGIELDPASEPRHNGRVQAAKIFTQEDNGLIQDWKARSVWLNPPYGRIPEGQVPQVLKVPGHRKGMPYSSQEVWIRKLLLDYALDYVAEALLLVNAETSAGWFQNLWRFPICFTNHRLKFINPDTGRPGGNPTHGSVIVYLGPQSHGDFIRHFSQFGVIAVKAPRFPGINHYNMV